MVKTIGQENYGEAGEEEEEPKDATISKTAIE